MQKSNLCIGGRNLKKIIYIVIALTLSILLLCSAFASADQNTAEVSQALISRVSQGTNGYASASGVNSPLTVHLQQTPTSGNLLVLVFGSWVGSGTTFPTINSISETGVTWSGIGNPQVQQHYIYAANAYMDSEIWVGIIGSDAATTITINYAASSAAAIADIAEYSGLATSSFLDKTAVSNGYSASPATGTTPTTTQANELCVGGILTGFYYYSATQTSATNGFTLLDGTTPSSISLAYLENSVSATGSYSSGTTVTAGADPYVGCIATFKAADSTTTPTPTPTPAPSTSTLNNAIIDYSDSHLTSNQISNIANNYGLFVCDFKMSSASLAAIKAINPNILIYGYIDPLSRYTSSYPENYYLHDLAGNRVTFGPNSGNYVMDITSSSWMSYVSTNLINNQLSGSYYTGIYLDDIWSSLNNYVNYYYQFNDANTGVQLTSSNFDSSYVNNWQTNMVTFLTYEKANMISSHNSVIINTVEELDNTYLNCVDGEMWEGFFYATWLGTTLSDNLNPTATTNGINAMTAASATGKILLIESLYPNVDSQTTQVANYGYTASMLGMADANCYFGYNVGNPNLYTYDTGNNYMPTLATNLGSPTDAYYSSQNVYMRDFTNGLALLNPSASSYYVNLGRDYKLPNGTTVSSLVLGPFSGEILSF